MPRGIDLSRWRLLAVLVCVVLLAGLTAAVGSGVTMPFDLGLNASFEPYRAPWLLAAVLWITGLGTGVSTVGMAAVASALLWSRGQGQLLRPLWTTFVGAEATTWAMKFLVGRARPVFLPGVATASSPSFPSAHATATMALIGILGYLVAMARPDRSIVVAIVSAAMIGLIGFSRIFLNVHYPTDVLGGFLVGIAWLIVGSGLAEAGRAARPLD
ncbi:MAG TPA: phosphatase PAP2 family protein [Lichenihabitans sp.]|jgi:undecaprenyl-diphosphatase|nr:phosphatase PAP2 family protein [Lichenihabitans sp.]